MRYSLVIDIPVYLVKGFKILSSTNALSYI